MKKCYNVRCAVFAVLSVGLIPCALTNTLDPLVSFTEQETCTILPTQLANSDHKLEDRIQQVKQFKPNLELEVSDNQFFNLVFELEEVKHIYGYVGDYVSHWYQIGEDLYDPRDKASMQVASNDRISLISTSCDCNEKYVDRDDEEIVIIVDKLKKGVNRFKVVVKVYERHGKYAGNSAEYHFYYKITLY